MIARSVLSVAILLASLSAAGADTVYFSAIPDEGDTALRAVRQGHRLS